MANPVFSHISLVPQGEWNALHERNSIAVAAGVPQRVSFIHDCFSCSFSVVVNERARSRCSGVTRSPAEVCNCRKRFTKIRTPSDNLVCCGSEVDQYDTTFPGLLYFLVWNNTRRFSTWLPKTSRSQCGGLTKFFAIQVNQFCQV